MTAKDELAITIKKHRWALVELVCDAKMRELNQLASDGTRATALYLLERYDGDKRALLAALYGQFERFRRNPAKAKVAAQPLRYIEQQEAWAYDELAMATAEEEVRSLSLKAQLMADYLVRVYGSANELLRTLRHICRVQKGPAKSLLLQRTQAG